MKNYGLKINGGYQDLAGGPKIVPRDYFSAKDFTTGKTTLTENTYSVHLFDGSWVGAKGFLFRVLRCLRYVFGRRVFDFFSRIYMKKKARSLAKYF